MEAFFLENYLDKSYWNGLIKMGLSRFFILRVLYKEPLHGYLIARRIAALTRGCCSPSEGALYPVLNEFKRGGYVTCRKEKVLGRVRKVYTLTPKGKQAYQVAVESWQDTTMALLEARDELFSCEVNATGNP